MPARCRSAPARRCGAESRRGAFSGPARVSDNVPCGTVFAPFHWAQSWAADSTPNLAASEAFDPRSKEPELKFAAVRLAKAEAAEGA